MLLLAAPLAAAHKVIHICSFVIELLSSFLNLSIVCSCVLTSVLMVRLVNRSKMMPIFYQRSYLAFPVRSFFGHSKVNEERHFVTKNPWLLIFEAQM